MHVLVHLIFVTDPFCDRSRVHAMLHFVQRVKYIDHEQCTIVWYLSNQRGVKTHASLCICTDSHESSLPAYIRYK